MQVTALIDQQQAGLGDPEEIDADVDQAIEQVDDVVVVDQRVSELDEL